MLLQVEVTLCSQSKEYNALFSFCFGTGGLRLLIEHMCTFTPSVNQFILGFLEPMRDLTYVSTSFEKLLSLFCYYNIYYASL